MAGKWRSCQRENPHPTTAVCGSDEDVQPGTRGHRGGMLELRLACCLGWAQAGETALTHACTQDYLFAHPCMHIKLPPHTRMHTQLPPRRAHTHAHKAASASAHASTWGRLNVLTTKHVYAPCINHVCHVRHGMQHEGQASCELLSLPINRVSISSPLTPRASAYMHPHLQTKYLMTLP